jgi:hypothetical protein
MGGSSDPPPPRPPEDRCPWRVEAVFPAIDGLVEGAPLVVLLKGVSTLHVSLATKSGVQVGILAGVPNLQQLIECLRDGVQYAAVITKADTSTVFCTITRQA